MLVVVRGVGAGADKAATFARHFVSDLFEADGRYEPIDVQRALGDPDQRRAARAFQIAEEMTQKGRSAYESLELDPAVEYLTAAIGKYERHAAYVTDLKRVADALMMLGATHILRGEDKTGARRLSQAVTVYPGVRPDPRVFNPSMRKIFQRAADRLLSRARGTLSLGSNPSYAAAYVDGNFVGVTPVTVANLTEGRHYVRLVKDGYRGWGRVVDVGGRDEATVTASFKPTRHFDDFDILSDTSVRRVAEGRVQEPIDDAIDQLGVLTNADHVLLGAVRLDGERVEVVAHHFDLNRQHEVKRAKQVFSYDTRPQTYRREIGELIRTHFGEDSPGLMAAIPVAAGGDEDYERAASSAPPPEPGSGVLLHAGQAQCLGTLCENVKNWILILGSGGGALLMGAGGVLWVLAHNENVEYRDETVQTSVRADALRRSGQRKALLGDILFGAGVAVVAASVGTYFLWTPTPSAEDVIDDSSGGLKVGAHPLRSGLAVSATWRF